ncbi:MAG: hypothetical protein HKL96_13995 [Phycisphaerales bacterium]|nr:hypothetical protein [Phycisphaerales bacterium]
MEKFPRDKGYDAKFDNIAGLKWYPYVGQCFGQGGQRIMVYAHNIPIHPNEYDAKLQEWKAKDSWATPETIEEYTYCRGWWTKTFRCFIKGAVGLAENYDEHSTSEIKGKIDSFIRKIAYINFIQGLVKSEKQIAQADRCQVEQSKIINREILKILNITHCICWGMPVYNYVRGMKDFKVISEENNLKKIGFASCIIDVGGGKTMRCLRIWHPSMPSRFNPFSEVTHGIFASFLASE